MRITMVAILLLLPTAARADDFLLKDAKRIVFLGDSNTYAGKFIAYLDAYLCTRFPDKRVELINLGLPSETVSGLSEPDHPYPRPDVHDRAARALDLTKPDVVIVCYGMNDGIYYPFSADRFKKYQTGILALIAKIEKTGARAIVMTPAPFDATSLKGKTLAQGAPKYSWLRPYERYDEEVLAKYSDWLLTLRQKKFTVIDAHAALVKHLATMRKSDSSYRVSADGIHPNANGHLVIALEMLKELQAPALVADIEVDTSKDPPAGPGVRVKFAKRSTAAFSFAMPLPMPADPAWSAPARQIEDFNGRVNRSLLKVEGPKGYLAIRVGAAKPGARRVPIHADKLAQGIDLAALLQLEPETKTAKVWKLIDQKNRLLGPAWLSYVGHKRPGTPKGLPIEEARKKAAVLDAEIRALCQPTEVDLLIGPFGK